MDNVRGCRWLWGLSSNVCPGNARGIELDGCEQMGIVRENLGFLQGDAVRIAFAGFEIKVLVRSR